ncbi:MAG: hypothetical protein ACHRXM_40200 [Isosphaerales bacterium]
MPTQVAVELAKALLPSDKGDRLTQLLEVLVDTFAAGGCALWEASNPELDPVVPWKDRLLVLASWFRGKAIMAMHARRVEGCLVGTSMQSGKPRQKNDCDTVSCPQPYMMDGPAVDWTRLLAVPFVFRDGTMGL